jgi:hypothetical protein
MGFGKIGKKIESDRNSGEGVNWPGIGTESDQYEVPHCGLVEYPQSAGHYEGVGAEIGRLVDKKQKAYGRSFDHSAQHLALRYPHGIRVDQYGDMLAMVRIDDKLSRIATSKNAFGENPWQDVAGYGLLMNKDYAEKDRP